MLSDIVCPYCNCSHRQDQEDVGEWLYIELKEPFNECGHTFVCAACEREFEVCINVTYSFSTVEMD